MHFTDVVLQLVLPWERPVSHNSTSITTTNRTPELRSCGGMFTVMMSAYVVHPAKRCMATGVVTALKKVGTGCVGTVNVTNFRAR
jgi:hypothetical protein